MRATTSEWQILGAHHLWADLACHLIGGPCFPLDSDWQTQGHINTDLLLDALAERACL